jgi:hypothetical protein
MALVDIAQVQTQTGDTAGARKTLAEALDIANGMSQIQASEQIETWTEIAGEQARAGDTAGARRTLAAALKGIGLYKDYSDGFIPNELLKDVAEAFGRAGDAAGVLEAADRIHNARPKRDEALRKGALGMLESGDGDFAGALRIANLIQDAATRERTISSTRVHPAAPDVGTSAWLAILDANSPFLDQCPLNTEPFLDVAAYLKSRPPSKTPEDAFFTQRDLAQTLARARNFVDSMLKQQARK